MTKLFALIESIKIINDWVKWLVREWTQYQIASYGRQLDERQVSRNMILDAIKIAQQERDENKMLEYSRLLAML